MISNSMTPHCNLFGEKELRQITHIFDEREIKSEREREESNAKKYVLIMNAHHVKHANKFEY